MILIGGKRSVAGGAAPSEPTLVPTAPGPVALVFRFRVPDDKTTPFIEAVEGWVRRARDQSEGAPALQPEDRVDLYQPVIGSAPDEWELRLGFGSMAALGGVLDRHPGSLAELQHLGVEDVASLDVPNPVLRRWRFEGLEG